MLTLERLEQRGLFATDVRARPHERIEIEVDTRTLHVLAEQTRLVRLFHSRFEARHGLT